MHTGTGAAGSVYSARVIELGGRYRIEERIAVGGMGELFRARVTTLGELVRPDLPAALARALARDRDARHELGRLAVVQAKLPTSVELAPQVEQACAEPAPEVEPDDERAAARQGGAVPRAARGLDALLGRELQKLARNEPFSVHATRPGTR
ncbi:MAG: hypothetical protein IT378_17465 [Sandaracinaceae bacterium]|nr:hypothetical protein [Sandaracinaceae bacterium]